MLRKIAFVVGNRAHFARVRPIIKYLPDNSYRIIVFEAAAIQDHGGVLDEINKITNNVSVLYTNISGSNLLTMTKSTGLAVIDLAVELVHDRPDVVVVIADRYEALAAAIAARYMNISLAHIQGGEITGSIDDSVRHAITKFANLHFVSNKDCAKRVIKMGEDKKNVFVTGCPTIDICRRLPKNDPKEIFISKDSGDYEKRFILGDNYLLVSFHPVTTEKNIIENVRNFRVLLEAIKIIGLQTIWMYPNIDAGGDILRKEILNFKSMDKVGKIHFFKHFNADDYLLLIKNSKCIVGNSSVGIRESSFLGVPSVNVGNRQIGRLRCQNVIDCSMDKNKIINAIRKQLIHGKYKRNEYYGDGSAGKKIASILEKVELEFEKRMTY